MRQGRKATGLEKNISISHCHANKSAGLPNTLEKELVFDDPAIFFRHLIKGFINALQTATNSDECPGGTDRKLGD